jgi:hypothetical protein
MEELAGVAEKSKPAQSAKSVGLVTRKGPKNEPLPEELLEILVDHLMKINHSGIQVEVIDKVYNGGRKGVGFLVIGVEMIEGKLRRIQEPE